MRIPIFQIDAFSDVVFKGNPAAVCPLVEWLPDDLLQAIAAENNLSETAFLTHHGDEYQLRWFTPLREVDLCGHATLAAAYVVLSHLEPNSDQVNFQTKAGPLTVKRWKQQSLAMDFPSRPALPLEAPEILIRALGCQPVEVLASRDLVAVFNTTAEIVDLTPDLHLIQQLECLGLIVTAPGEDCDFVSRFFAPQAGIPEDPVTGSAHCTLIPYWSQKLGKSELFARQVSARGGELICQDLGDRVLIAGRAVQYLSGILELAEES
jgi:PhzF family phenazine biosynthesis protein